MRIACLHLPDFPLAAWLRVDPDLYGCPVAVTDGGGARAQVISVSPEAIRGGVTAGMSVAQAGAIDADLVFRPASRDAEDTAQAALRDVARSRSPRVEDAGAGTVYLDCEGLWRLHGSERELVNGLVGAGMRVGLDIHAGIASSRIVAGLCARNGNGATVVPQEEEWRFLAPLPVEVLEPSAVLRERLLRWGVRTLGDLAALPASAVATRLGPEGGMLARRARGEGEELLAVQPTVERFEETVDLDHGMESLEAFRFVLRALLDRLTARLQLRGFVCGDLHISLRLANMAHVERTVNVTVPGNDVKALLALACLQLEACPPAAPIEAVRVAAVPERLQSTQLDLFRPGGPAPKHLAVTLARLAAICGTDRVGFPAVADSHRPDAYGMHCSGFGGRGSQFGVPDSGFGKRGPGIALRAIRPLQPLEVFTDHGQPDFVRARVEPITQARSTRQAHGYGCSGRVVTSAGPWRTEGAWWEEGTFSRDYYDVQLSNGVIYRLFYDPAGQVWFLDGVYD